MKTYIDTPKGRIELDEEEKAVVDRFFNDKSINIFTDGSVRTFGASQSCGYGAYAIVGALEHPQIYQYVVRERDMDVIRTEMFGVYTALQMAMLLVTNPQTSVRIYSDNEDVITDITQVANYMRVYNDGRITMEKGGNFSDTVINNLACEVNRIIVNYDILMNVELYHIKGHLDMRKRKDMFRGIKYWGMNNKSHLYTNCALNQRTGYPMMQLVSYFNGVIDSLVGKASKSLWVNRGTFDDPLPQPGNWMSC